MRPRLDPHPSREAHWHVLLARTGDSWKYFKGSGPNSVCKVKVKVSCFVPRPGKGLQGTDSGPRAPLRTGSEVQLAVLGEFGRRLNSKVLGLVVVCQPRCQEERNSEFRRQ